jgi:hypothetical protein
LAFCTLLYACLHKASPSTRMSDAQPSTTPVQTFSVEVDVTSAKNNPPVTTLGDDPEIDAMPWYNPATPIGTFILHPASLSRADFPDRKPSA